MSDEKGSLSLLGNWGWVEKWPAFVEEGKVNHITIISWRACSYHHNPAFKTIKPIVAQSFIPFL